MTGKTPSPQLLQKYLANECSEAERKLVDAWYQDLHLESTETFSASDEDRLLMHLQSQIARQKTLSRTKTLPLRDLLLYAGGIAAMLALSFGLFYLGRNEKNTAASQVLSDSLLVFSNTQKKVVHYSLPDQTEIWLHPGAEVHYPRTFAGRKNREIQFEGEGFFNVTRDSLHPFVIRSGTLTTQVLGTSFNVKAYTDQPVYSVAVVTGSVSVSASGQKAQAETVILKPQQQVTFERSTSQLTINNVETRNTLQETWQPVSLSFTDASLADITERLQKTFRVKIKIENPALRKCELKADFDRQNLPEILEMINTLIGSTYEMDGDHIVISGEGCGDI